MIPRLLVTPGEPAGIGADITLDALNTDWPAEIIVVGNEQLIADRAKQLGHDVTITQWQPQSARTAHLANQIKIHSLPLNQTVIPGQLAKENSAYVLDTLKQAATLCLNKTADALVTGPVHKGIINEAGFSFSGHTEYFAQIAGVKKTIMLFVIDQLKVALVTTHIPLSAVSQAITQDLLNETLQMLHHELREKFTIDDPRILVCGLNPHAGENGYLGHEEIDTIEPVLMACRSKGMKVIGPLPADTIFTPKQLENADCVLSMYHDQALPVVKYIGFGKAVNVTLGLPFIRTSVDHGTALDLAGSHHADAGSLKEALKLAIKLS